MTRTANANATQKHTSRPSIQAASILSAKLDGTGFTGQPIVARNLEFMGGFIGMWLVSEDSSDYRNCLGQNRLEPITIRSGKRRYVAAIPS